jgi:ribulose-5-phosphate 4-epimerase/fuculose-1-phosphate aldolase
VAELRLKQWRLKMNRTTQATALVIACTGAAAMLLAFPPASSQNKPTSAGPTDPALIKDLVAANRILANHDVLDGYGHISVRDNRNHDHFLMARSLAPELVTSDDILEYDLDAVAINLNGRSQYGERYIHAAIYKARPDVMAIVHSHTPAVIPFGVSSVKMRPVYHLAGFIGKGLPVFDIREPFGITQMLVNTAPRAQALAQKLGDSAAVLMRGHGIAVTGTSLPIVVGRSIYIDVNARIQLQAINLGGTVTYLDPDEARLVQEDGENAGYRRSWEVWQRQAPWK